MIFMRRQLHPLGYVILVLSVLFSVVCQEQAQQQAKAPDALVESISKKVIQQLRTKKDIANNIPAAYAVIQQYVSPYMDSVGMARSVLGRQRWKAASTSQRKRFTNVFKVTVMRTYAVALAQYTNETVRVMPLRGETGTRTIVKTQILGDGPAVAVNYRVVRKKSGWKVYDFDVEGVSMLRSFRSQFAEELSKDDSLNALIDTLQQHNRDVQ